MVTRRKLKQKAPHLIPEHRRDLIVVRSHQILRSHHALFMCDALVYLHAIKKTGRRIPPPPPDGRWLRPAVKRRVQLHRTKDIRIVGEPVFRRRFLTRIKDSPPVRVEPTRTAHMDAHPPWTALS